MSGNPPAVVYRARSVCPAVKLTDDLAREIAIELQPLGGTAGNLRQIPARAIVEHARNPQSAIHGIIWGRGDAELAYEARCQLARQVVQSIRIVATDEDGEFAKPLLVTIRVSPKAKPGYMPTEAVAESTYMAEQIQQRATSRLKGWLDEFRAFRHGSIGPLWDAVNVAVQDTVAPRTASKRDAPHRESHPRLAPISHVKKSA